MNLVWEIGLRACLHGHQPFQLYPGGVLASQVSIQSAPSASAFRLPLAVLSFGVPVGLLQSSIPEAPPPSQEPGVR